MQWWKADKSKLAFIDDLDVELTPVDDIPGRHLFHIRAGAKSFERTGGEWISPLSIECLWGDGERIMLNASAGEPRASSTASPLGALLPEPDPAPSQK